jgi:hypothetical protein
MAMLETDSGEPAPTVPQIDTQRGLKKRLGTSNRQQAQG